MKTVNKVAGLLDAGVGAIGAVACQYAAWQVGHRLTEAGLTGAGVGWATVWAAAIGASCALGTGAINLGLESLFGEGGLVLDFGRWLVWREARASRAVPAATRLRVSHPSPRLRARGAKGRIRGRGCPRLDGRPGSWR